MRKLRVSRRQCEDTLCSCEALDPLHPRLQCDEHTYVKGAVVGKIYSSVPCIQHATLVAGLRCMRTALFSVPSHSRLPFSPEGNEVEKKKKKGK